MRASPQEFERLVSDSLTIIPEEIRPYINNVQIVIKERPSKKLLKEMGVTGDETLFGLYTGTPLTDRAASYAGMPDCILIFRKPLLEQFDDPLDLRREVARTVIHEVAHHFGIAEERLVELGWD